MAVPEAVRARYGRDKGAIDALHGYVKETLAPWCDERDYGFSSRPKKEASVAEKLETGRYSTWLQLDDLVAATIVVPTRAHEETVITKLDAVFAHGSTRGRGSVQQAPDVFRFDSTRWYGRVPKRPEVKLEARCFDLLFEVQIQTAFENAWVRVTHDLVYKGQSVDWAKQRLAAQLKATVEQLDLLIDTFEASASEIPLASDPRTDAQAFAIDKFASLVDDNSIDTSVAPESWKRFGECVFELARRQTRNADEAKKLVKDLVTELAAEIRGERFQIALSGSLFQAVIAHNVAVRGESALERFPIVWSQELNEFYGVRRPDNSIDLDN